MKTHRQVPAAAPIINSMRALGYAFDSALADVIDNSLTADSTVINISFDKAPLPRVCIVDNGTGMDKSRLFEAMRHGSTDPRLDRDPRDLGRYGLGLKTASLSQCRCLTVASLVRGTYSAARWDLDLIEKTNDWTLLELEPDEINELFGIDTLRRHGRGTLVVWERFDRAAAGAKEDDAVERLIDAARDHLALTFHRFIDGERADGPVAITINGFPLSSVDPFMRKNKRTEALPAERIEVRGHNVVIQPYILPHLSYIRDANLRDDLRQSQGFYLYRNMRLICHGTWFNLIRHEQLTKLARVSIDIPNAIDDLWTIDIRKSTAQPPPAIRERLRQLVYRIADRSEMVFRERRRRLGSEHITHLWKREAVRDAICYSINRDHPFVTSMNAPLSDDQRRLLEQLLEAVELALPSDAIYADMNKNTAVTIAPSTALHELKQLADTLLTFSPNPHETLKNLPLIEPFSLHRELTSQIIEEISHGRVQSSTS